jgi:hypothetical protein
VMILRGLPLPLATLISDGRAQSCFHKLDFHFHCQSTILLENGLA